MMVETMLESSQDFGMSNGALPQWKRELLQRRAAARSRPAAPPSHPPPPPPPPLPPTDDDEELRYGPGIVKRLQSRYLSLALRDAPRRKPSVLRRAASLEHMLDERPPPAPCTRTISHSRPPRPQSMATPPALHAPSQRRESVKRARSVDALSRIDAREESRTTFISPPPPPAPPIAARPPQAQTRLARTPRRPTPLLRETERPPPDVVRSTLRKFESAPTRRAAPAARVTAVLRDLKGPRTSTPEPRDPFDGPPLSPRTPSPLPRDESFSTSTPTSQDESAHDVTVSSGRPVSRAALEGIARAGSTVRYAFEVPRAGSHLPPLAATNSVLLGRARRIGVIRPMPARTTEPVIESFPETIGEKASEHTERLASPPRSPTPPPQVDNETHPTNRIERREPPPAALVEPIPRTPPDVYRAVTPPQSSPPPMIIERSPSPEAKVKTVSETIKSPLMNGHAVPERMSEIKSVISRIGAAGIERAWSGSGEKKPMEVHENSSGVAPWARGTTDCPPAGLIRRPRAPPPASTSIVFNFSNRKEVPDYIENDGIILRANRKNRIKAGEPGVVVLRPEALARSDSDSETETDGGPPSPCAVRFINDNILINGKSSMLGKPNKDRISKLKLQFDDSLTRTFEYPSETSLCEEGTPTTPPPATSALAPNDPARQLAEPLLLAPLAANTHITSAALSRYTPSKTAAGSFQLGVTRHDAGDAEKTPAPSEVGACAGVGAGVGACAGVGAGEGEGDARPCGADAARSWSEARTHATDLLF